MKEEIQEKNEILENMDQAIISYSKTGLGYTNKLGLKIINDLQNSDNL